MPASDHKSTDLALLFLTSVSFLGLLLAAFLIVNPSISNEDFAWRKPLVGSMFASICVLGALAVFFPNQCSKGFSHSQGKREKQQDWSHSSSKGFVFGSNGDSFILRGHHPVCEGFSSHVFSLDRRVFCATCSGLFLGGVLSLVGTSAYFFGGLKTGPSASAAAFIGLLGVATGLLQSPLLKIQRSSIRVFSGAFFPVGAFLVLVAVDELERNLFVDVFLVFLTLLWLVTRISLSQWEHEKVCSTCSSASCKLGH